MKLVETILNGMSKVCKPQKKFMIVLMSTIMSAHGKINYRNMSRYGSLCEKTFSRQFKKDFNFAEFNQLLLKHENTDRDESVAAFDPAYIPKSGDATFGHGKFWSGCSGKVERGLEISALVTVNLKHRTAYVISAKQTPIYPKDGEDNRIDGYVDHIVRDCKFLPFNIKYLTVDAYFAKMRFIDGIKDNTSLEIVGKLRIDANLRHLFDAINKKGVRGRPKKYGKKFDIDDLDSLEYVGVQDKTNHLYTAVLNSPTFKRDIKLVLVRQALSGGKYRVALLYSTDIKLSAAKIYEYYCARFQIEFVIRDAKQFTGLTDCQARSEEALNFHFNACFMALNLIKIQDRGKYIELETMPPFSMATHKTVYHNETLIESFFAMFGLDKDAFKSHPLYKDFLEYGVAYH